ncbi:hypothetical protein DL765_002878 [Monosporascus sp. GIB2]|nr:hypothetical protein DL765_002878 [Monosporascus sp. GIB2]
MRKFSLMLWVGSATTRITSPGSNSTASNVLLSDSALVSPETVSDSLSISIADSAAQYRNTPAAAELGFSPITSSRRHKNFTDFLRYIPNSPDVHAVFTSRSRSAEKLSAFQGVHVAELEEDQAVTLFFNHVAIPRTREKTEDEVKSIVKELGCLALAITVAASYVSETPRLARNLSEYLEEFHRRRRQLLDRFPDELTDKYDHSVMTVWETSYSAIYDQLPEARRVLTLLAFVNYEDIFLDLFGLRPDPSRGEATWPWTSAISDQAVDLYSIERCFAVLERYSLVQRRRDAYSYSVHRLVHAWDRDRLEAQKVEAFCLAALDVLYRAVQHCRDAPEAKRRLVPHLKANFDEVVRLDIKEEEAAIEVVNRIEWIEGFNTDIGSWGEAAAMKKEVLEKRRRIVDNEHPHTIKAMNTLAITLRDQGKLEEAAVLSKEVFEKRQRILGDEHPDTITAMNNLAITLGDQGKLEEAAAMLKEVLEKRQRILGDEHPDTISAMNNLAITLGDQGKPEEAAAMKEVLEKRPSARGGYNV